MFRSRSPTPTIRHISAPFCPNCQFAGSSVSPSVIIVHWASNGDTEPVEHKYNVSVSDAPAVHTSNISAISTISIQYYSHCQHQYQYQIELETTMSEG